MARWWPKKFAIPVKSRDGIEAGPPLIGYQYAWWQWIKRRHAADPGYQPFEWRSIRISLRRPENHWRNDDPPIRPRNRLRANRDARRGTGVIG